MCWSFVILDGSQSYLLSLCMGIPVFLMVFLRIHRSDIIIHLIPGNLVHVLSMYDLDLLPWRTCCGIAR